MSSINRLYTQVVRTVYILTAYGAIRGYCDQLIFVHTRQVHQVHESWECGLKVIGTFIRR